MVKSTSILFGVFSFVSQAIGVSNADLPAGVYHNTLAHESIKDLAGSPNTTPLLLIIISGITILSIGIVFWLLKLRAK